jgi:hypothetical protein
MGDDVPGDGSGTIALRVLDGAGQEVLTISVHPPPPAVAAPEAPDPRYGRNLLLSAILGVLVCAWLATFTEDLPTVAATLGLGGSLVWLAFLSNLVSETRRKELQKLFDQSIMSKAGLTYLLILLGIISLGYALTHGTILFISKDDTTARAITVYAIDDGQVVAGPPAEDDLLSGNSKLRLPLATFPWPSRYLVHMTGLPPLETEVWPFALSVVRSPASFKFTPVVIVRLDPVWANTAAKAKNWSVNVKASGTRNGHPKKLGDVTVTAYDGKTLWVGCDSTVVLPDAVKERWRHETGAAAAGPASEPPLVWFQPAGVLEHVVLRPGDALDITVFNSNGFPVKPTQRVAVRPGGYDPDRIQEVFLQ